MNARRIVLASAVFSGAFGVCSGAWAACSCFALDAATYGACYNECLTRLANNAYDACVTVFGSGPCSTARRAGQTVVETGEQVVETVTQAAEDATVCLSDPVACANSLAASAGQAVGVGAPPPLARLSGTVRDDGGKPLPGILVSVSADEGSAEEGCRAYVAAWRAMFGVIGPQVMSSLLDGTYEIWVPACGNTRYTVSPAGVTTAVFTWTPPSRTVTIGQTASVAPAGRIGTEALQIEGTYQFQPPSGGAQTAPAPGAEPEAKPAAQPMQRPEVLQPKGKR